MTRRCTREGVEWPRRFGARAYGPDPIWLRERFYEWHWGPPAVKPHRRATVREWVETRRKSHGVDCIRNGPVLEHLRDAPRLP